MSDIATVAVQQPSSSTTPRQGRPTRGRQPRTNRSVGFSSRPYWLYLLPGGAALRGGHPRPADLQRLPVPDQVVRASGSRRFIGLDNYVKLLGDARLLGVVQELARDDRRDGGHPDAARPAAGRRCSSTISASGSAVRASACCAAVFYLPQVLPVVVAGIVWGWILRPDGAFNAFLDAIGLQGFTRDWLGDPTPRCRCVMLVMVWVQIGYPVVIFMSALQRVDPEIYEAAEIDGAGYWARFRAITLPQISPETFVVALTCTIAALKVFGPIYALTRGGPENATNVPSYFAYFTFFKKLQVGYGAAIATVLTLIIVLVAVAIMRWQARERAQGSELT